MKIIDLTHDLEPGMPCFKADWHEPFSSTTLGTIETVGRNTKKLVMGSHTGTHIDAPAHFIPEGKNIADIPLGTLCGDVTLLDLRHVGQNTAVTPADLQGIKLHQRVICIFGWDAHWDKGDFYQNYPYFSEEAAQFLIESGVKILGMDTPSPDDSRTPLHSANDSAIHKLFLKNDIILIEYLANTETIDFTKEYQLIALPMKIKSCDGAPARVILIEKEE
jgi:arylformamidase